MSHACRVRSPDNDDARSLLASSAMHAPILVFENACFVRSRAPRPLRVRMSGACFVMCCGAGCSRRGLRTPGDREMQCRSAVVSKLELAYRRKLAALVGQGRPSP